MTKTPAEYAKMLQEAFDDMDADTLCERALRGWREGRFPGIGPRFILDVLNILQGR